MQNKNTLIGISIIEQYIISAILIAKQMIQYITNSYLNHFVIQKKNWNGILVDNWKVLFAGLNPLEGIFPKTHFLPLLSSVFSYSSRCT